MDGHLLSEPTDLGTGLISMTTFHPFPRLPFELRAQVWELTVEPRRVEVRVRYKETLVPDGDPSGDGPKTTRVRRLVSFTPVPATLQACREARNLGLSQQAFSELFASETRYLWFNWEVDMLSAEIDALDALKPIMHLIRTLKFDRRIEERSFYFTLFRSQRTS
jgi:hypothetical protein